MRLEKSKVGEIVSETVEERENMSEDVGIDLVESLQEQEANLHTEGIMQEESRANPLGPMNILSKEEPGLLELARQFFTSVSMHPGDFKSHDIDTRRKETQSTGDFKNTNSAVLELTRQNKIPQPKIRFRYLRLADCMLYSVVAGFLVYKGWKRPSTGNGRRKESNKWRHVYEEKAKDIRNQISTAKSEIDGLKENRKVMKKGKRNWVILKEWGKVISESGLVSYM